MINNLKELEQFIFGNVDAFVLKSNCTVFSQCPQEIGSRTPHGYQNPWMLKFRI